MSNKVYKKIEIVGTSTISISDAVSNAVSKASETVRNLDWFEVTDTRGYIQDGKPVFQVEVKVGFRIDD